MLALLVVVNRRATGSRTDSPSGDLLVKTVNIFNLPPPQKVVTLTTAP